MKQLVFSEAVSIANNHRFILNACVAQITKDLGLEIDLVIEKCEEMGVQAVVSDGWAKGGKGTKKLAKAVVNVVEANTSEFKPLYDWNSPVKEKIEKI